MSAKGLNQAWIEMPAASFDADQPMSCYRAWNCMQNLQHLIDSSGQYRVNTVATTGKFILGHGYTGSDPPVLPPPSSLSWEFPLTMMHPEHPPNFDIRVAAMISDDGEPDATIVASVTAIHDNHDIWGGASQVGRLYYSTATVDSETASWVIDDQFIWPQPTTDYLQMLRRYTVTENGGSALIKEVVVRFTIAARIAEGSSQTVRVVGAQFREFA